MAVGVVDLQLEGKREERRNLLKLDASSLAAALLHAIPEDCGLSVAEIEARFGSEIAKLVDGTTKLGVLEPN